MNLPFFISLLYNRVYSSGQPEGFKMKKILIVEDEKKIARLLQLELEHRGFETETAYDGMEGLNKVDTFSPDIILLDIMLPEIDGIEVAKLIRERNEEMGIIMLTALDQIRNKIEGLNSGADDYITKPFDFEELNARIESLLRRKGKKVEQEIIVNTLKLHPESYSLIEEEEEISLSKTEYELLLYLVRHRNRVVSKDELLDEIWGYDFEGNQNVVEVYINYLRKKIKSGKTLIKTVRGVGYTIKE